MPPAQVLAASCCWLTVRLLPLGRLGADPMTALTAEEREQLQTEGFLMIEAVLSAAECEEAKRRIHAQMELEEPGVPFSVGHEKGALRLSNIFNKDNADGLFDAPLTNPKVLACMRLMLGDSFKLSAMNSRGAEPGAGGQAYHTGPCTRATAPCLCLKA